MGKINFIELPTRNLPESEQFYQDTFGLCFTRFGPDYACTITC